MEYRRFGNTIIARIDKGEEILAKVKELAAKENIRLTCGRDKAMKLLAELDTGKGVGLIERIKQGQGKPTRIYVKRFTTQELPPQPEKEPEPPAPPPAVDFADVQKSDFPTSRSRGFRRAEVGQGGCHPAPAGRWRVSAFVRLPPPQGQ